MSYVRVVRTEGAKRPGDDVVVSAVFQPNAPGRGELRSIAGLRARQMLKSRAQHLGERVRLDVGDGVVTAWRLGPFGVRLRCAGRWPIGHVLAIAVEAEGVMDPEWPAIALVDLPRLGVVADLRARRDGAAEREVVRRLMPSVPVAPRR